MRPKTIVREETQTKNFVEFETDYWLIKWPVNSLESFGKKLQKKVDHRQDWQSDLIQEIMKRLKFRVAKDVSITLEYAWNPETVPEFFEQVKKQLVQRIKFDETSKQSTIDEAMEKKGRKVKPANKETDQDKALKDDLKKKKSKK